MKKTENKQRPILLPRITSLSCFPAKKHGFPSTLIENILKKRYKHKNTYWLQLWVTIIANTADAAIPASGNWPATNAPAIRKEQIKDSIPFTKVLKNPAMPASTAAEPINPFTICPKIPAPGIPSGAATISRPFNSWIISRRWEQTNPASCPSTGPVLFWEALV